MKAEKIELNVSEWEEFRLGDIFKLQRGKTLTAEWKEDYKGEIPCINGTVENNGVQCCLSKEIESVGFKLISHPAITIVRVGCGGKTFVQEKDFYVADNAFALIPLKKMSYITMLFISTLLDLEQIKYSYGRTITKEYLETIIKLPIRRNRSGEPVIDCTFKYSEKGYIPDWEFMENYIKSLHHKPLTTILKIISILMAGRESWVN